MLTSILAVPEVRPVPVSLAAPRTIIAIKSRKIDELWIYNPYMVDGGRAASACRNIPPSPVHTWGRGGRWRGNGDGRYSTQVIQLKEGLP